MREEKIPISGLVTKKTIAELREAMEKTSEDLGWSTVSSDDETVDDKKVVVEKPDRPESKAKMTITFTLKWEDNKSSYTGEATGGRTSQPKQLENEIDKFSKNLQARIWP